MFMVIKEDIENVLFKCEKILEANKINFKRLRKEEKMLSKVIKDYEVTEDNSIIFNELFNRQEDIINKIDILRCEEKRIKKVIAKIRSLLSSMEVIEDDQSDIEPAYQEIGQLE